jgi:hypothetical protein
MKIAALCFLKGIEANVKTLGVSVARGQLIRTGKLLAESLGEGKDFESMKDFVRKSKTGKTPITEFEGHISGVEDGYFVLKVCPFKKPLELYLEKVGDFPESYSEIVVQHNNQGGAAVSPFCIVHQIYRVEVAEKIKIGGERLCIRQVGCRSLKGEIKYAEGYKEDSRINGRKLKEILAGNACVYSVSLSEK